MAKKFGDAYIEVHARTATARAELRSLEKMAVGSLNKVSRAAELEGAEEGTDRLRKLGKEGDGTSNRLSRLARFTRRLNDRFGQTTGAVRNLENQFHKSFNPMTALGEKLRTSWARMDSTVRLVLGLILTSAGPAAAALSGLSAAATAMVSSLAYAAAGVGAMAAVLPGFIYGVGLAAAGLGRIEELAPQANKALGNLKSAFSDVDVPAFMAQWEDSLTGFMNTLAESLRGDTLAASLGGAFSKLTDAFTNVFNGSVWGPFIDAMEGPLATALGNMFSAIEPLTNGVLSFLTAAAPFVQTMSEMFGQWAGQWSAAFQAWTGSAEFTTFINNAISSLDKVFGLLGAVKDFLGTVFAAGVGPGNTLLFTLTQIFDKWTAFLKTAEGQSALAEWFGQGLVVMNALTPLLTGLGQALNLLVTPVTVGLMADLFASLGAALPLVAQLLEAVSHLGILNLVTDLLLVIMQALEPLMPMLSDLALVLGKTLGAAVQSLSPVLKVLADALGAMLESFGPVLVTIIQAFATVMEGLAPVFQKVLAAVMPLIPMLADFLAGAVTALVPIILELATKFGDIAATVLTMLMPVIQALLPIITSLLPVFVQLVVAANPVLNLFLNLLPALMPLVSLLADLLTWVLNLIAPMIEFIAPLLEWIVQFLAINKALTSLGEVFAAVWSKIFTWLKTASTTISAFVEGVLGFFTKMSTKASEQVFGMFQAVTGFFRNIWTSVTGVVDDLVAQVLGFFSRMGSNLGSTVSGIVKNIVDFFINLRTRTLDTINALIRGVINFFTGLPGAIVATLTSVSEAISAPFRKAFNGIVDLWNGTIGKLSWSVPDWVPIIGGKTISAPKLSRLSAYASGGIVAGPTTALIGEAGPEAVIPLRRPLSQVDPAVRDISAMLQGKGGAPRFGSGGVVSAGVTIAQGAITVVAPESNPHLVAASVLDRIAAQAR